MSKENSPPRIVSTEEKVKTHFLCDPPASVVQKGKRCVESPLKKEYLLAAKRDKQIAFWMLLPSIILIAVFVYGFIGNTVWVSVTDWGKGASLAVNPVKNYVGLQNYANLFSGILDARFRQDLVNAVFYSVMLLVGAISLGMIIAVLLDQKPKGENFFRTLFLFPLSLSFIVSGTIWRWLLAPHGGINMLPAFAGMEKFHFRWLSSKQTILQFNWQNMIELFVLGLAMILILIGIIFIKKKGKSGFYYYLIPGLTLGVIGWFWGSRLPKILFMEEMHGFNLATIGIILATVWQFAGYTMALYLAGFRGISQDLLDAARLDGASDIKYYRYVAIPLLKPITISAVIILSHISLKMFDLIFAMTGPDNAETGHPALLMYLTTFRANDFAKGAAIAVVLFMLAATFIIPYLISSYNRGKE